MTAYAALTSLGMTILKRYRRFLTDPSVNRIVDLILDEVESLMEVLEQVDDDDRSGSERVGAFEGQIRDAVYELEDSLESLDLLESLVTDQLLSQSEERLGDGSHLLWLDLQQYVDSFTQKVVNIKEEYIDVLLTNQSSSQEYHDFCASSSSIAGFGFGGKMPKMVGLSNELIYIKRLLMGFNEYEPVKCILGMAGTGKTTLAREIFEDPLILNHFDYRIWVTIGPKYNFDEIMRCIVAQANPENNKELLCLLKENEFPLRRRRRRLHRSLKSRYLFVLDDAWDNDIRDRLEELFPGNYNGSRVLVTTRKVGVGSFWPSLEMRFMNEEESWNLLREKVFGKESCRRRRKLKKVGKEIAKNCEGYPPEIIKLAQLLSKSERNVECWRKVAETRKAYNERLNLVSSRIDSDGKKPVTFGLSDDLSKIKDMLIDGEEKIYTYKDPSRETILLVGMAGIGKTTLATEVFEDPLIWSQFDVRVWITVGPKYELKEILQDIARQVNPGVDIDIDMSDWYLYKSLKNRRYLIVLDDVWDTEIFTYVISCFPGSRFGSKFLVTTELRDLQSDFSFKRHEMHLLNNEESWCLLRQKVFGEESCPFRLEKAGKMIAQKCEGLPLAIVTVANLLSKENKTPDYWNQIATVEENSVFRDAYDQMSNNLIRSYNYSPRSSKAAFLYMGVFSKNYVISRSKLNRIWDAEGFIEECLKDLIDRNLAMVCQKTSSRKTKTCKLHSVFWHMCNRTAEKNKFFHALSRHADGFAEGITCERRLSVRNSVLFRIKDVYHSMASISTLRSLLYTGPYYQYSVQICSAWRMLRVLDAHTIRFYQFPIEAIKLVLLRYFAITYNGKLPPSISKLRNLQYLIVHRHLGIKFSEDSSYLPVEIWKMRALKHLQVEGSNLPDPPNGALLEDLLTLLDVSARTCTKRVLECIPNLEKLGIQIELAPDAAVVPLCCFDISCLHKLKSLKCVIMNPEVEVVKPLISLPSGLRKLTLCGFGYPWEYMSIISSLQKLIVLKLRSYAFRGPKWETFEWKLGCLKLLVLEDIDLVDLNGISSHFPALKSLIMRHCYKLRGIPSEIGDMRYFRKIELVDCSSLAMDSAKDIREQWKKRTDYYDNSKLEVRIYSSWK